MALPLRTLGIAATTYLTLWLTACGHAPSNSELPRARAQDPAAAPTTRVEAPAPARGLRALDFAGEQCATPETSALGRAILAIAPQRMTETGTDSGGPPRCSIRMPTGSPAPGASFADLDGDGVEEALVAVGYERQGHSGMINTHAVAVLRASNDAVALTPMMVVLDDSEVADGALTLESVEGIRAEGHQAIVTARAGCYDCGCDTVEVVFDCTSTPCRALSHRVTEPVADCDSP